MVLHEFDNAFLYFYAKKHWNFDIYFTDYTDDFNNVNSYNL